jgi:hypothetical protein
MSFPLRQSLQNKQCFHNHYMHTCLLRATAICFQDLVLCPEIGRHSLQRISALGVTTDRYSCVQIQDETKSQKAARTPSSAVLAYSSSHCGRSFKVRAVQAQPRTRRVLRGQGNAMQSQCA